MLVRSGVILAACGCLAIVAGVPAAQAAPAQATRASAARAAEATPPDTYWEIVNAVSGKCLGRRERQQR